MIVSKKGRRLLDGDGKLERREKRTASADAAMKDHHEREAHKRANMNRLKAERLARDQSPKMDDQQRLVKAVKEAQPILGAT